MKISTKLWILVIILIILTPLGLFIPEYFRAGAAWGEWGADEIREMVGYIPQGLHKLSGIWNAPVPDYSFKGWEEADLLKQSIAYIISAVIGIAAVAVVIFILGKVLIKEE
jgi:hypothetical protein